MNAPEHQNLSKRAVHLPDVQGSEDLRRIAIQRVGIRGVRHPVLVKTAAGIAQPSIGTWALDVHLPETQKGTHMSRFIALLEERYRSGNALDVVSFRAMLHDMAERLEADSGQIELRFPYFISKTAPASGLNSLMDYEVTLTGRVIGNKTQVNLTVLAPVTSLCPCSKEISEYGAHNQRSHVTMNVELLDDSLTIEDLVAIAEEEASCALYGMLKRTDEKFVTERAYDNPKFVEDLVRDVVARINEDARIGDYVVEVENFESIHNHSAYARIERVA